MFSALILAAGLVISQPVVVDGDTIRDGREPSYRIENIDAPETGHRAQCPAERALGEMAKEELRVWVTRARRVEALPSGFDRYGRTLARIEIDGVNVGERMIARGLARPWRGRKHNFCAELEGDVTIAAR